MKICCPFCNKRYDVEGGKYECICGNRFIVDKNGDVVPIADLQKLKVNLTDSRDHSSTSSPPAITSKYKLKCGRYFERGNVVSKRYEILSELGNGCMGGTVYKCFDRNNSIEIVLNTLPLELLHDDFIKECVKKNFRRVLDLVHQNIAICKGLGQDEVTGISYLIMEYVEGINLRVWINSKRQEGTLTLDTVISIIKQISNALEYALDEDMIYPNIRPENIMIDAVGHIKVLGNGFIAADYSAMISSVIPDKNIEISPYNVPDEWCSTENKVAVYQYALAVMTYEMLADRFIFNNCDKIMRWDTVLNETASELVNVPDYVNNAIRRAMRKDPNARFASCSDFISAIEGRKEVEAPKKNIFQDRKLVTAIIAFFILLGFFTFLQIQTETKAKQKIEELEQARLREEQQKKLEAEKQARLREEQQKKLEAEKLVIQIANDYEYYKKRIIIDFDRRIRVAEQKKQEVLHRKAVKMQEERIRKLQTLQELSVRQRDLEKEKQEMLSPTKLAKKFPLDWKIGSQVSFYTSRHGSVSGILNFIHKNTIVVNSDAIARFDLPETIESRFDASLNSQLRMRYTNKIKNHYAMKLKSLQFEKLAIEHNYYTGIKEIDKER